MRKLITSFVLCVVLASPASVYGMDSYDIQRLMRELPKETSAKLYLGELSISLYSYWQIDEKLRLERKKIDKMIATTIWPKLGELIDLEQDPDRLKALKELDALLKYNPRNYWDQWWVCDGCGDY